MAAPSLSFLSHSLNTTCTCSLDYYIQASLLFSLAGCFITVGVFAYYTAPETPNPQLHSTRDTWAWGSLGVLWLLCNIFFAVRFTHAYVDFSGKQREQEEKLLRRRRLLSAPSPSPAPAAEVISPQHNVRVMALRIFKNTCIQGCSSQHLRARLGGMAEALLGSLFYVLVTLPFYLLDSILLCGCCSVLKSRATEAVYHHIKHHVDPAKKASVTRLYGFSTKKQRSP